MSFDHMDFQRDIYLSQWRDRRSEIRTSRAKGTRALFKVTGLVLHQTSFNRGSNHTAYDSIGTHFVILPDGTTLTIYDETTLLHASLAFNSYTVAVEFVGNFPRDDFTWWSGNSRRDTPTSAQIFSGRCLVNYLQNVISITHVFAHRQAAPLNRRGNCPGPHIWCNIGEWALQQGLSDGGPNFTERNGTAIPDTWRNPGMFGLIA